MIENKGYLSNLPVFFIVGRGRSGSTLLRTILDAHPVITIPPESRFVQYLYYLFGTIRTWTPDLALNTLDFAEKGFEPPQINRELFSRLICEEKSELSFSSVCKALYLSTPSEFNKERIACIGDKNPRYSFFIPVLLKIFPEARFIHLVRDPRDNLLAVKRVHKAIGEIGMTPVVLSRWKYYNRVIENHKAQLSGRFLTMRFEDLIADPEKEIRRTCEFLKLPFDPTMLNYIQQFDPEMHGNSYALLHKSLRQPFNKAKAGEWKVKLSPRQEAICNSLAGKQARVYSYQPGRKFSTMMQILLFTWYAPLMFTGTLRFRLKNLFYRFPYVMKIAYNMISK